MKKKFACNPKIIAGTLDNRYPEIVSLCRDKKEKHRYTMKKMTFSARKTMLYNIYIAKDNTQGTISLGNTPASPGLIHW